ncbi:DUF1176 domain-containing protein [Rosenbergiella australiborealis]|uniref:DUF1176 domain-containing protein n=1 Tax=Rosenbergiella australiborealis TaxID=1544696 RepID=A0ABS5TA75_9GAMM|nr:DUF1176 domain-containing protein [Rosenbergiella australiborealis]MBT0728415.1 DUF1176 domain-containing protein [Rosenbergiella australiborealis]
MKTRWKVLPLLAGMFFSSLSIASEPVQRLFQQWQVTCNNLNDCDVRNANPDDDIRIILTYQAGPKGAISLDMAGYDSDTPEGIWVDGNRWQTTLAAHNADKHHDAAGYSSNSLVQIQAFLQLLTNATTLSLSDDTDEGTSLAGLMGALNFIDERQGRLHNRTALIVLGEGSANDVPHRYAIEHRFAVQPKPIPIKDPNHLIETVMSSQADLLDDQECTPEDETLQKSSVKPLDSQHALVMINCVTGAYQSSSILFIVPRNHPERAKMLDLPIPLKNRQGDLQSISWFTDPHYDPQRGLLFHVARGRGLADCGESAIWRFNGKIFELMSYHNQPTCDGGEPGNWPSVWLTPGFKETE